jgi:biopolymer transport protein ExbD
MSPWLDLVLLLVFFLFIQSRIVLRPGVVVELPVAEFSDGVPGGMIAVVTALDSPQGRTEVVFFDDEPYVVASSNRMAALEQSLLRHSELHGDTDLTIYADQSITHVTLSRLMSMARGVGLDRVNLGTGE